MSRKIIGIMFMVFCVCGAAQAQIVLNPPASVGSNSASMSQDIGWMFTQFCDGMTTNMFSSWVNSLFGGFSYNLKLSGMYSSDPLILDSSIHCTSSTYYSNFCVISFYQNHKNSKSSFPVIEFDISSLSGAGVTEENFQSAYIDGLQVTATSGDITKATINDLVSWYQNGYNDHWGYIGERPFTYITDLFNTAPSVGTIFNDIDVTAAVYEDLFGAIPAQNYSGFVIDRDSGQGTIVFDDDLPSLRIIIDEPEVPTLSILGILVLCCCFSLFALLRTLRNEKS